MKSIFFLLFIISCASNHKEKSELAVNGFFVPEEGAKRIMDVKEGRNLFDLLPYSASDKETLQKINLKKEIIVAVVDSGINCADPFFKGRIWVPEEIKKTHPCGYNTSDKSGDMTDHLNHGTKVASLILSLHPSIKVFPIKALGDYMTPQSIYLAGLIILKNKHKINVVNISLQGGRYSRLEEDMIKKFQKENISLVISSGNNGTDNPMYPARLSPQYDSLIVVGGSTRRKVSPHYRATFNERYVLLSTVYEQYALSTNGKMQRSYGTSFAAPVVSGVVALMKGLNPNLKPKDIKEILKTTANESEIFDGINEAKGELNIQGAIVTAAILKKQNKKVKMKANPRVVQR